MPVQKADGELSRAAFCRGLALCDRERSERLSEASIAARCRPALPLGRGSCLWSVHISRNPLEGWRDGGGVRDAPPFARDFVGGGVRLWLNLEPTVATLDFVVIIDLLLIDSIVALELLDEVVALELLDEVELLVVVDATVVRESAWDATEVKLSWLAEGIIADARGKFTSGLSVDLFWLATLL